MAGRSNLTRTPSDRCWQCGAKMQPDRRVCLRCGATRVAERTRAQLASLPPTPDKRMWSPYADEQPWAADREDEDQYSGRSARVPTRRHPYDMPSPEASYDTDAWQSRAIPRSPDRRSAAPGDRRAAYADRRATPGDRRAAYADRRAAPADRRDAPGDRRAAYAEHRPTTASRVAFAARVAVQYLSPLAAWGTRLLQWVAFGVLGGLIGGGIWYAFASYTHFEVALPAVLMGYLIGEGVAMGAGERGNGPAVVAVLLTLCAWTIALSVFLHQGVKVTPLDFAFLFASLLTTIAPARFSTRHG